MSFQTEGQEREPSLPGQRFVVLAAREADRGHREDLEDLIDELMQTARRAPGFERVNVVRPYDEPAIFLHYELWRDKDAHDAFDAGPEHATFAEHAAGIVAHHDIPRHYPHWRTYTAALPSSTSGEPRLPPVDPEAPDVRDVFVGLPAPLQIFRVLANAPTLFAPLMDVASNILGQTTALDPATTELAILQVGQLCGADYEIAQHKPLARDAGLQDAQITAILRGDEQAPDLDEDQRAVLRFTREAVTLADVSDQTWASVAAHHSPRALTELLIIAGFYRLMCSVMRAARLDIEPATHTPSPNTAADGRHPLHRG